MKNEDDRYILVGKSVNGIHGMKLYFSMVDGKYSWETNSKEAFLFKTPSAAKNRVNRLSLKKLVSTVYGIEILKKDYSITKVIKSYV